MIGEAWQASYRGRLLCVHVFLCVCVHPELLVVLLGVHSRIIKKWVLHLHLSSLEKGREEKSVLHDAAYMQGQRA